MTPLLFTNKISYIYKITNIINNKIYIGQSINPAKRFKQHINDSKRFNYTIHKAIKKYGELSFKIEILETCYYQRDADAMETYYINLYDSRNRKIGYNIHKGGMSGNSGLKPSIETKNKMRKSRLSYIKNCEFDFGNKMSNLNKGSKNGAAILNENNVIEIKNLLLNTNLRSEDIALIFKVSKSTIGEIARGKIWGNIGPFKKLNRGNKLKRKLNDEQVKEILILSKTLSRVKIGKLFNVSSGTIHNIIKNNGY